MRRVYLLQPDNMPLKTVMKYGEERDRACEINAAFVARTRSHAELIYLRHLHPTDGSGNLDFSKLWHEDGADVNRRSLERTERIAGFFGDLELDVPDDNLMAELCSSSEARAALRGAVKKAYKAKALEYHPDKARARTTTRHRLTFPSGNTGADEQHLNFLFQKARDAYEGLKKWLEGS